MDIIISISSGFCLLIGSFICLSGAIGMLRFPDFYTRMHAASVTDTSGVAFILVGLMINSPDFFVLVKLVIILLLGLLIGPTTGHVLAKTAFRNGVKPQLFINKHKPGGDTLKS